MELSDRCRGRCRAVIGWRRPWQFAVLGVFLALSSIASVSAQQSRLAIQPQSSSSYVIDAAGSLSAWGLNAAGQLGDGSTANRIAPVPVKLPAGVTVRAVAAGQSHGLAAGSDGKVYAWGGNTYGQLGDGTTTNRPAAVAALLPAGVTATSVAAGRDHSLALASDGRIYSWGYGRYGQLGNDTTAQQNTPVRVSLPAGVVATAVAGGNDYSVALSRDGKVYSWGFAGQGQLGNGLFTQQKAPVETKLPAGVTVTAIASGRDHCLGKGSDGKVYAWGYGGYGQIGTGATLTQMTPASVALPTGVTAAAIAAGANHSLMLGSDGKVYVWGANANGQLGTNDTQQRSAPTSMTLPTGVTVTAMTGGLSHSLLATSDGKLYACGANTSGQIGDGTTTQRLIPVLVQAAATGNTAPTISDVVDRTTNEDTPVSAISFTIGDSETATAALTLVGSSSDTTVVASRGIVFGGAGAGRTVTLTPVANRSGVATITLTVSDGSLTASESFLLSVAAVNDPPTISPIADQVLGLDGSTGPLSLTVGDIETDAAGLVLLGSSSNATLVPNANIVFGGVGANRTVNVTPAIGQTGTADVTVTVRDRNGAATSDTFAVVINAPTQPTGIDTLLAGNAQAPPDTTVGVQFDLMNITPVDDFQFLLTYDAKQLALVGVERAERTAGFDSLSWQEVSSGKVLVLFVDTDATERIGTGRGPVVVVRFRIGAGVPEKSVLPLVVSDAIVATREAQTREAIGVPGAITVVSPPPPLQIVSGSPQIFVRGVQDTVRLEASGGWGRPYSWKVVGGSTPAGINLQGATGLLTGIATTLGSTTAQIEVADSSGAAARRDYTFVVGQLGNIVLPLSSGVNVGDVKRAINISLKVPPPPTALESKLGDVNRDGQINLADVTGIMRIVLGLSMTKPVAGTPVGQAELQMASSLSGSLDEVTVPFVVRTSEDWVALQTTLLYDPAELSLVSLATTRRAQGASLQYVNGSGGRMTVLLINLTGQSLPTGTGSLFDVTFRRMRQTAEPTKVEVRDLVLADLAGQLFSPRMPSAAVSIDAALPASFTLDQNIPNPFNAQTVIHYALPQAGEVRLDVFALSGRLVRSLVLGQQPEGEHLAMWDGLDDAGVSLGSGIYHYRLQAGGFATVRKMLLMK